MIDYLFISPFFNNFSGPNTALLDLCNEICKNKKIILLTTNSYSKLDFSKNILFNQNKLLPGWSKSIIMRFINSINNVDVIKKQIERYNPRKIIVNYSIDIALQTYFALNKKFYLGYNVLYTRPHKNNMWRFNLSLIKKFQVPFFELLDNYVSKKCVYKIVAHSEFQKKLYISSGIDKNNISIIPHCISLNRIYNTISKNVKLNSLTYYDKLNYKDEHIIFFPRRLIPEKGVIEMLNAYEEIINEFNVILIIRGSGPLKNYVIKRSKIIKEKNPKSKIILFPTLEEKNYLEWILKSDVIIIPSLVEAFGMVILESMSLKRPVITTKYGGSSEIIENNKEGLLINPSDPIEFLNCLKKILSNKGLQEKMGNLGFEKIKNTYDSFLVALKMIDFLEA